MTDVLKLSDVSFEKAYQFLLEHNIKRSNMRVINNEKFWELFLNNESIGIMIETINGYNIEIYI